MLSYLLIGIAFVVRVIRNISGKKSDDDKTQVLARAESFVQSAQLWMENVAKNEERRDEFYLADDASNEQKGKTNHGGGGNGSSSSTKEQDLSDDSDESSEDDSDSDVSSDSPELSPQRE